MTDHPVVGLIGKKRVGKDTLAAELVAAHGFTRLAFADKLKEAALGADPLVQVADHVWRLSKVVELVGWEKAKSYPDVRRFLQNFGVAFREFDSGIWVRPVETAIRERTAAVVVTDVRFPNEAEMIYRMGGKLVRIERPSVDDGDGHESESALPSVEADVTIQNVGTAHDLLTKVPRVLALYQR